jgi:hypothetical protein
MGTVARPFPLSPDVARWLLGRGFSLSAWEEMPIAADAAAEEFGEAAWHAAIDHGRWLTFILGRTLLAEVRPGLVALDRELPYSERRFVQTFQQAVCVDLRAVRLPRVRVCLALANDHQEAIERGLSEAGRSALVQLIALLEGYLASALVRPRPEDKSPKTNSDNNVPDAEPAPPADRGR